MRVRPAAREVLVDIAFPVRDDGDAVRRRQHFAGVRRRIQPALRLLACSRARTPRRELVAVPVPDLGIDQTEQRVAPNLERQSHMQQQSPQGPALADRTIAARPRASASQRQFGRVLNHHHIPTSNPRCRTRGCVAHHFPGGHAIVAQEAREPHLLRPSSCKSPDTRARPLNQRRVQSRPPFSRRRSPNRPSPNSMPTAPSANQHSTHGISPPNYRQPGCVHTIAAKRGEVDPRRRRGSGEGLYSVLIN